LVAWYQIWMMLPSEQKRGTRGRGRGVFALTSYEACLGPSTKTTGRWHCRVRADEFDNQQRQPGQQRDSEPLHPQQIPSQHHVRQKDHGKSQQEQHQQHHAVIQKQQQEKGPQQQQQQQQQQQRQQQQQQKQQQSVPDGPKIVSPHNLLAKYNYKANLGQPGGFSELSLKQGEKLTLVCKGHAQTNNPFWWEVRNDRGEQGFVPGTFVLEVDKIPRFGNNLIFEEKDERENRVQESRAGNTSKSRTDFICRDVRIVEAERKRSGQRKGAERNVGKSGRGESTGSLTEVKVHKNNVNQSKACPKSTLRKDFFRNLRPVSGGIGMKLLQKMGWNEGEGLGKRNEGILEPIAIDLKLDRLGLRTDDESPKIKTTGRKGKDTKPIQIERENPICVLNDYCQKWKTLGTPVYTKISEGKGGYPVIITVTVGDTTYHPAEGSPNRREAKAKAAREALKSLDRLGLHTEEESFKIKTPVKKEIKTKPIQKAQSLEGRGVDKIGSSTEVKMKKNSVSRSTAWPISTPKKYLLPNPRPVSRDTAVREIHSGHRTLSSHNDPLAGPNMPLPLPELVYYQAYHLILTLSLYLGF